MTCCPPIASPDRGALIRNDPRPRRRRTARLALAAAALAAVAGVAACGSGGSSAARPHGEPVGGQHAARSASSWSSRRSSTPRRCGRRPPTASRPPVTSSSTFPDPARAAQPDPHFQALVRQVKARGITLLGYISTEDGQRPAAQVQTEVRNYKAWYGVTDIFLDRVSGTASDAAYYRQLASFIHTYNAGSSVWLNPGQYPDQTYMSIGDVVMVFEGTYAQYLGLQVPGWVGQLPGVEVRPHGLRHAGFRPGPGPRAGRQPPRRARLCDQRDREQPLRRPAELLLGRDLHRVGRLPELMNSRPLRVATLITRLEGGAGVLALRGATALDPGRFRSRSSPGAGITCWTRRPRRAWRWSPSRPCACPSIPAATCARCAR